MLYAKSLEELRGMIELLTLELQMVGLHLNEAKTKLFTTNELAFPERVEIHGRTVTVLVADDAHTPNLFGQESVRSVGASVSLCLAKFHQYKDVFLNKHIAILKMKLFDAAVSPMVLLGLETLSLTKS